MTDTGKHSALLPYGNNYCRDKFSSTISVYLYFFLPLSHSPPLFIPFVYLFHSDPPHPNFIFLSLYVPHSVYLCLSLSLCLPLLTSLYFLPSLSTTTLSVSLSLCLSVSLSLCLSVSLSLCLSVSLSLYLKGALLGYLMTLLANIRLGWKGLIRLIWFSNRHKAWQDDNSNVGSENVPNFFPRVELRFLWVLSLE